MEQGAEKRRIAKLDMDFVAPWTVVSPGGNRWTRTRATRQLCTRAGMIMEDASLLAITMPAQDSEAAMDALVQLERDAQAIARLIAAAVELASRARHCPA